MLQLYPIVKKIEKFADPIAPTQYLEFLNYKVTKEDDIIMLTPSENNNSIIEENLKKLYIVTIDYIDLYKDSITDEQVDGLISTLNNTFIIDKSYNIVEFDKTTIVSDNYNYLNNKIDEFSDHKPFLEVMINLPGDEDFITELLKSPANKKVMVEIEETSENIKDLNIALMALGNVTNIIDLTIIGSVSATVDGIVSVINRQPTLVRLALGFPVDTSLIMSLADKNRYLLTIPSPEEPKFEVGPTPDFFTNQSSAPIDFLTLTSLETLFIPKPDFNNNDNLIISYLKCAKGIKNLFIKNVLIEKECYQDKAINTPIVIYEDQSLIFMNVIKYDGDSKVLQESITQNIKNILNDNELSSEQFIITVDITESFAVSREITVTARIIPNTGIDITLLDKVATVLESNKNYVISGRKTSDNKLKLGLGLGLGLGLPLLILIIFLIYKYITKWRK